MTLRIEFHSGRVWEIKRPSATILPSPQATTPDTVGIPMLMVPLTDEQLPLGDVKSITITG